MLQILHNITNIKLVNPARLTGCLFMRDHRVAVPVNLNATPLPLVGLADCTVTTKTENKSLIYTTSLTATLSANPEIAGERCAFVLETIDGTSYLLGSDSHPYPLAQITETLPGKESDPSIVTLNVEYSDLRGLSRIIG